MARPLYGFYAKKLTNQSARMAFHVLSLTDSLGASAWNDTGVAGKSN